MSNMLCRQKGFTLIEVIITIVIAALVGTVMFVYLGNVLTRSHEPIGQLRDRGAAIAVMEDVVEKYQAYRAGGSWSDFTYYLDNNSDVSYVNIRDQGSFNNQFDIMDVKITVDNQTISAIFTE